MITWTKVHTSKFPYVTSLETAYTYYRAIRGEMIDYQKWCRDNVGRYTRGWNYDKNTRTFYFKRSEDALAFKIRWAL